MNSEREMSMKTELKATMGLKIPLKLRLRS